MTTHGDTGANVIAVAADGSIFVDSPGADGGAGSELRIRRILPNGIITSIVIGRAQLLPAPDRELATAAILSRIEGFAVSPAGYLYYSDNPLSVVRRLNAPYVADRIAALRFASADGAEEYLFDVYGRHSGRWRRTAPASASPMLVCGPSQGRAGSERPGTAPP